MASSSTQDFFYDSIAVNFYMNADTAGLRAAADDYGYEVRSSGDVPLTNISRTITLNTLKEQARTIFMDQWTK